MSNNPYKVLVLVYLIFLASVLAANFIASVMAAHLRRKLKKVRLSQDV